jgi:hypothetical protein
MLYTAEKAWSTCLTVVVSFLQEEKIKTARDDSKNNFFIMEELRI